MLQKLQKLALILILFATGPRVLGQSNQIWLDDFTNWTINQYWEHELNIGGNYLLENNGWKDYYFNNALSWQPKWWAVTDLGLEMHFTYDPKYTNTTELRISPGQKIIFTPFIKSIHLEKPYVYGRYDFRAINYIGEDTIDIKQRIRLRAGGRFILNNTVVTAKSIYVPFYYELFFDIQDAAVERFAAKNRLVVGLGYAFTNKFRAEFTYYHYRSKNTIEDDYVESDKVYQLLVRYFIY